MEAGGQELSFVKEKNINYVEIIPFTLPVPATIALPCL